MITLGELLSAETAGAAKHESPHVRDEDAFLEAQVNAVLFDAITSTLRLIEVP